MTSREFLDEPTYPVSSGSTLIAIISFVLLIWLVGVGMFDIWLAVAVAAAAALSRRR